MPGTELLQYCAKAQDVAGRRAIAVLQDSADCVAVFGDAPKPEDLDLPAEAEITARIELGGSAIFRITGLRAGTPCARAHFAGLNTLVATRNGESAEIVVDWLRYHAKMGMEGAVILDRSAPGTDAAFLRGLSAGLAGGIPGLMRVVQLNFDTPLGQADLPPEAHPYCVPEAPGKARMDLPPPDPWAAPLGVRVVLELLRAWFLAEAKVVASLDVHDLIAEDGLVARTRSAPGGVLGLLGRHVFPGRLRRGDKAHFADHVAVQFDGRNLRRRWSIAPDKAPADVVWDVTRIRNTSLKPSAPVQFFRHMALRHSGQPISRLVPKSSLVEHPPLRALAREHWRKNPSPLPQETARTRPTNGRHAIVTCMKNEGPFILDWLAWHRAIGFDDFLVYSNDCTDGTDVLLDLLAAKGLVEHRANPYQSVGLKPQHAALQAAEAEPVVRDAAWLVSMDVDEYVNIKTGDGTLRALFAAVPDTTMIAMTWRLFGNGDCHHFEDRPVFEQFTHAAPELCRKPHQAWGFKTLFQNLGHFRKLGVHRPKGLKPQFWQDIRWVNGSGRPLPREMYRTGWRSTLGTYGYDLVQLNHYAVRTAESFLVKRDRGRVNHTDRDQGAAYWFRMNNNAERETSILAHRGMFGAERARLMADAEIAAAHAQCVIAHRARIAELRSRPSYQALYADLTSERMQRLSRLHSHFGANVFLAGPDVVPDDVVTADLPEDFYFTVERGTAAH
ncbi:MAG: glycosyltransferase family 2 protein [Pseudomonadota bacterium]